MKIAIAQIDCLVEDLQANCNKFSQYAAQAKKLSCDLVVFPEISDLGYVTQVIQKNSKTWTEFPYQMASAAAKDNSINLICGISEREGAKIYNSLACFDRSGNLIARYRKNHLFTPAPVCEDKCFTPGSELTLIEIDGLKIGLSICYDLRFPELYRELTFSGAIILINCSAWPAKRLAHWDMLTRARAIENQAFFIGAARVGSDNGLLMSGNSRIISPTGDLLAEASADKEELLVGEINTELVYEFRAAIPAVQALISKL